MEPQEDWEWIQTYTGKQAFIEHPFETKIDIVDIAHHLSCIGRFCGAARTFYPVAQHSVYVAQLMSGWWDKVQPAYVSKDEAVLCGLMHDSPEYVLNDLPRPVKYLSGMVPYRQLEMLWESAIMIRFGLHAAWEKLIPQIKEFDTVMLMTERRDLLEKPPKAWTPRAIPAKFRIDPWSPKCAEVEFMKVFNAHKGVTYVNP